MFGKIFAVEFATLEELITFKKAMGCPLVLYNSKDYLKMDINQKIVIHDSGYID